MGLKDRVLDSIMPGRREVRELMPEQCKCWSAKNVGQFADLSATYTEDNMGLYREDDGSREVRQSVMGAQSAECAAYLLEMADRAKDLPCKGSVWLIGMCRLPAITETESKG